MDLRPIGIIDSGFGGLSTLRQAVKLLPCENFLYYGDNANAPYGNRTQEDIQRLTVAAAKQLEASGVKVILIACNTATAAALHVVQKAVDFPVVGICPAIVPAFAARKDGIVLALATQATIRMPAYQSLHASLSQPEIVKDIGCPADIVRCVESGIRDNRIYIEILDQVLRPYHDAKVDGIVLGCTHYPFMESAIREYARKHFKGRCEIFEGGKEAVTKLSNLLKKSRLENNAGSAQVELTTSGDLKKAKKIYQKLFLESEQVL